MTPRIALLLGRTVWTRDASGWRHESFHEGGGAGRNALLRLTEVLSAVPAERAVAVFEPEGLVHQTVETPKVNRATFASLARVRNEHPVVDSENLGWGIEYPDPGPSGFLTLIHSELTPGLVHLRDACARAGCRLSAAWSAYTAAIACAKSCSPASKARFVLVLTPDFAAIAVFGGGRRSFRGWVGPMAERDWKAFSAFMGDSGLGPSPLMAESGLRRGSMVVIAHGEPEKSCPIWKDILASGRVEAVADLEAFAISAARIPAAHPANLVEAFPRPRELDRIFGAAAIIGFSAAAALGAIILNDWKHFAAEGLMVRARAAILQARLKHLGDNQKEMDRLRIETPDASATLPVGRHDALLRLAAAIPDALTLTSLEIGRDGSFELEALVVGERFEPENTRLSLERCGFAPVKDRGWVFDSKDGRLWVRGRYGESRP